MNKIPLDIIKIIISYTYNVDLRRQFNIYQKLNIKNFDKINTVIRELKENHIIYSFNLGLDKVKYNYQFELQNVEKIDTRELNNIDNDTLFIEIIIDKNQVKYKLEFLKLKKKPYPEYYNPNDFYYKGELKKGYYWETNKIEYYKS